MVPGSRPLSIPCESNRQASAARSQWQADPGIRRRWTPQAVALPRGAMRDLSGPVSPHAPAEFPLERHDRVLQFDGTDQGSWLGKLPAMTPEDRKSVVE